MNTDKKLTMREGFWMSRSDPWLPDPTELMKTSPWKGLALFAEKLRALEKSLVPDLYRGISICRCCGKVNGNGEYQHEGWVWPSGYLHYIEDHNVRPSLAFQEFVLGRHLPSRTFEEDMEETIDANVKLILQDEDALFLEQAKKVIDGKQ